MWLIIHAEDQVSIDFVYPSSDEFDETWYGGCWKCFSEYFPCLYSFSFWSIILKFILCYKIHYNHFMGYDQQQTYKSFGNNLSGFGMNSLGTFSMYISMIILHSSKIECNTGDITYILRCRICYRILTLTLFLLSVMYWNQCPHITTQAQQSKL